MADAPALDVIPTAREGEALFARGDDDALIRRERKTQADFAQPVTLTIDGTEVTVPRATPVTDAQGNIKYGPDGLPVPRATTIYDAAAKLWRAIDRMRHRGGRKTAWRHQDHPGRQFPRRRRGQGISRDQGDEGVVGRREMAQHFSPFMEWRFNPDVLAAASKRQRRLLGDHDPGAYD